MLVAPTARFSVAARRRITRVEEAALRLLGLLDRLARRRWATILALGVAVAALRLALLPLLPIPQPWVPDESSYLLAADTFASGRLANPTPAFWRSFEAIHVIMQPTYASKYPPGQAAFLAIGQVVFGDPYWGVVLGMALFCAAVCWMLQSMTSPGWALMGGILAFGIFGINHYWMQSYWGGGVAAFGGCLIIGAAFRMLRKLRPERYAWPLCAGIAVVFFTRPYEGSVFAIAVLVLLTTQLWPKRRDLNLRRLVLPCALVFSAVVAFQAYYDWRVTGSAVTLPYAVHERQYSPAPTFWFQPPRKDVPRPSDPMIYGNHWRWELDGYYALQQRPVWRRLVGGVHREFAILEASFGILVYLLWLAPLFWSASRIRFLSTIAALVILAAAIVLWSYLHYLAPVVPAILALLVLLIQKVKTLAAWRSKTGGTCVALLGLFMMLAVADRNTRPVRILQGQGFPASGFIEPESAKVAQWAKQREDLKAMLIRQGGQHLVIVHYAPNHQSGLDWVYNGANIDRQKVIWARDRGPVENAALISHYNNRRVWLVQAGADRFTFDPYASTRQATNAPSASNDSTDPHLSSVFR